MHTGFRRFKWLSCSLVLIATLSACGKKDAAVAVKPDAKAGDKPAQSAGGPPKPMGLPVKALEVSVAAADSEVTAVGTLLAAESVVIRPEIAGRIVALNIQEGQGVRAGTRLLALDQAELQAQLAGSTANAKTEIQRYERTQELFDKNFISQEALDVARGNMNRAKSRQKQDEALLAKTVINAPFAGVLGLRQVSLGAYVKAGDDIVKLDNIASLKMDFRVPEVYAPKLKPGQTVQIRVDAFPSEAFAGKIYALEPSMDEKTRTVMARAQVPNTDAKLRPGMFARVNVLLETRSNALWVPEQAIWPQGSDSFVYRVVDGKAVLTKVEIGLRRPGSVEIAQGVSAGDTVVTDGQMKLKDGAPVIVLPSPSPQPTAQAPAAPKSGS